MARTRVIYQSEAVFVSQDVAYNAAQTGTHATTTPGLYHNSFNIAELNRVQSANYSFNVTRQDVNQFGELAAIDQCIVEAPTVSFDTSYYLSNFISNSKSLETAYDKFYTYRKPKVEKLVKQSRLTSKIAITNRFMEVIRNFVLKATPESFMKKQMLELYELDKTIANTI